MLRLPAREFDASKELLYVLLLATVQFAHIVDFVVIMPLGPVLMDSFAIGPSQFSILVSCYNFSAAICAVLFGGLADRYDRRFLLLTCMLGFCVGTFLCSLAPGYFLFVLARIITGGFGGMITVQVYAIITDLIPYERRGKSMGIVMSAFSVASILGVPLGVAIADYTSWHYTFVFIGAFSSLILVGAYLTIPSLTKHLGGEKKNYLALYKSLLARPQYLRSFGFIILAGGSMFLLIPFLSPYAVKNMKVPLEYIKYAYLIGGLVTVITARIFGILTDKVGGFKLYTILVLFSFIPLWLFTNSGPVPPSTYLIYSAFFMSLVSGRMIPCMTFITAVPSENERGAFMSVFNAFRSFGTASMSLVGGLLIGQSVTGELTNYAEVGYLSMAMGITTIGIGYAICKKL
jgi:predicted MFS family arabinose efflux permease